MWYKNTDVKDKMKVIMARAEETARKNPNELTTAEQRLDYHLSAAMTILAGMRESNEAERIERIRAKHMGIKKLDSWV